LPFKLVFDDSSLLIDRPYPTKCITKVHRDTIQLPLSSIAVDADIDFMSQTSFQPSQLYRSEALMMLLCEFPYISYWAVFALFDSPSIGGHYSIFYDKVVQCIVQENKMFSPDSLIIDMDVPVNEVEKQWNRLKNALMEPNIDAAQAAHMESLKSIISREDEKRDESIVWAGPSTLPTKPTITDPVLIAEIHYVEDKMHDMLLLKERAYRRRKNQETAKRNGTLQACSCCCDELDVQDMISCSQGGHWSCMDCLQRVITNQVYLDGNFGIESTTKQLRFEFVCFCFHGCNSGFDRKRLDDVLPKKLMKKYDEIQFAVALDQSGVKNEMVSCPKCHYQASLPLDMKYYTCPRNTCEFQSCRDCGEEPHAPLECHEVEKKQIIKGRLSVEEAISATKIRNCPSCNKAFIKRYR
jgi:hypothetical protein